MIIKIDTRETELIKFCEYFLLNGPSYKELKIVVETLPIGDIILVEEGSGKEIIFIERKSIKDLSASIKDGRYEEQSYRLNGLPINNHNIIYLIEGDVNKFNIFKDKNKMDKMTIYSSMISILYYKGFSVLRSINMEETALIICNMAYKINKETKLGKIPYSIPVEKEKEKEELNSDETNEDETIDQSIKSSDHYCSVVKKVKKENVTPENIGEIILCQIPGISSITAIAIMKKFKTIQNMIIELKNDINCLDGLNYINQTGQTRKISKLAINNIITYLSDVSPT
jgi:ERCC4-type nuclease